MTHGLSRRNFLIGLAAAGGTLPVAAADPPAAPPKPAPAGAMRFSVTAQPTGSFEETLAVWEEAERLGYDGAFVFDHFMGLAAGPPPAERCLEAWTHLSALAARTRRIRVGVLVSGNTYRHPAVVAKMAATVDAISRGRLILGLGAAWLEREHTAYGIPFYTPGERARRLGEAVEVIRRLLTTERSTYEGRYYTLRDAPCEPKPPQRPHPPILIGGMGTKVVQPIAARHAQIWHFFKPGQDVAAVKALCDGFDTVCNRVGRDPAEVEKSTSLALPADDAGLAALRTSIDGLRAAGVRHVVFLPPPGNDGKMLGRVAQEVLPTVRGA